MSLGNKIRIAVIMLFLSVSSGCSKQKEEVLKANIFDMKGQELYLNTTGLTKDIKTVISDRLGKSPDEYIKVKADKLSCNRNNEFKFSIELTGPEVYIDKKHFVENIDTQETAETGSSYWDCFYIPPFAKFISSTFEVKKEGGIRFILNLRSDESPYIRYPTKGDFEKTAAYEKRVQKYNLLSEQLKPKLFDKLDLVHITADDDSIAYDADLEKWVWTSPYRLSGSRRDSLRHNGVTQLVDVKKDRTLFICGEEICKSKVLFQQSIEAAKVSRPKLSLLSAVFVSDRKSERDVESCMSRDEWHDFCEVTDKLVSLDVYLSVLLVDGVPFKVDFLSKTAKSDEEKRQSLVKALDFFTTSFESKDKLHRMLKESIMKVEDLNALFETK